MKKNIFLIFLSTLISACYSYPDTLETPNRPKDPFKKNPYTNLPLLPPGFGPSRGPSIAPRDGKYPADYFKPPPSTYNSFNFLKKTKLRDELNNYNQCTFKREIYSEIII